jgi:2-methylcitrate dehydratase PrpD
MHTNRPDPVSDLEAKFSVQYCVARALVEGKVVLEHFERDAYREPAMQDLLKRVHAAPYAGKLFAEDDPYDAEVKITLADGTSYSEKVDRPLGRTSDNAIATADMKAKFVNCASRVLEPEAAADVCRRIDSFEELESVREFTRLIEPTGSAAGKRAH